MKVTVCFGPVNVIVPCGNGEISVANLTERAIARYRKATNKQLDDPVEVHNLETIADHGILDPEDTVCEVLDDRDKLIAIFDEDNLSKRRSHNGGDGTSASSTGTTSPDVFQHTDSCVSSVHDEFSPRSFLPIKESFKGLDQKLVSPVKQGTPPPVPPKPNRRPGQLSPARISSLENKFSEDSVLSHNEKNELVGGNLNSQKLISNGVMNGTSSVLRCRSKHSGLVFAAVGTPIKTFVKHVQEPVKQVPEKVEYPPLKDDSNGKILFLDLENGYQSDEEQFTLGRSNTRKSMFADNPILDRWAEKQEQNLIMKGNRQEPAGQATSPSDKGKSFIEDNFVLNDESNLHEPKLNGKHKEDTHSLSSLSSSSDSEPDVSVVHLKPLSGEGFGLTVGGYRTADGRELGLIVQDIAPDGCAAREGRLQIADRISMINGKSIMDVPNDKAEEIFHSMMNEPVMELAISRSHTFIPDPDKQDCAGNNLIQGTTQLNSEVNKTLHLNGEVSGPMVNGYSGDVQQNGEKKLATNMNGSSKGMIEPVMMRPKNLHSSQRGVPSVMPGLTMKKVNKRYLLELEKGADGLGFSITTRDNPAGGHAPIFIKSILAKGAAISDGRLKSGDQLIEVNGIKLNGKSQSEAVNVLRSTRGLVKLLVQREEIVLQGTKPAIEVNEESTAQLRKEGNEVLKLKIPLNVCGTAGLGVSVKGKSRSPENDGRESPEDKGIFVKSVISGGAAQKDGRLKPDDQLLSVNGVSLMGLTNSEAMELLRDAMQNTYSGQAFIDVTIARKKEFDINPGVLYASKSLEDLNAPDQERSIEAVPSLKPKAEICERKVSEGEKPVEENNKSENVTDKGDDDSAEDDFTTEPLNLTPLKQRNLVKRNESYCHAVNRTMSPFATPSPYGTRLKNPGRVLSPLAVRGETPGKLGQENPITERTRTFVSGLKNEPYTSTPRAEYPTSTVGCPTPSVGTTASSRLVPPRVPPRKDSVEDVKGNYAISHQLSSGKVSITGFSSQTDQNEFRMKTRPPPLSLSPTPPQSGPSSPRTPPSYQTIMSRKGSQPQPLSSPITSSTDYIDSAPLSPLSPFEGDGVKNPFDRDAIGRQSMSEKRGRATLDAKQSTFFVNRERLKEDKGVQPYSSSAKNRSSSEPELSINSVQKARAPRPMLLRSDSEGCVLSGSRTEAEVEKEKDMRKVVSTGSIIDGPLSHVKESQRRGDVNMSFRNAVENANIDYSQRNGRLVPSGHSASQEDIQDEVPITMTSYSNFPNSVQPKLAKKPFYKKVFKVGKNRRGEYALPDIENKSPGKLNSNKETLIDFPAPEQKYRQLGQCIENLPDPEYFFQRPKTLPTRGRKKHQEKMEAQTHEAPPKVSRVTVSQPTKV